MSDPSLSKIYLKRNVVFEYASALSILSMSVHALCLEQHDISGDSSSDTAEEATSPGFQAIWEELAAIISQTFSRIVAERTRNPTSAQTTAIAGGLLHTIIRCSAHLPPDSRDLGSLVAKTIPNIVRLLATKEGVYSLTNRYPKQFPSESGEDELNTLLDLVGTRSVLMAKACECIRESIKEGKRRVEASTQGAVQVIGAMCGSHEHRLRSTLKWTWRRDSGHAPGAIASPIVQARAKRTIGTDCMQGNVKALQRCTNASVATQSGLTLSGGAIMSPTSIPSQTRSFRVAFTPPSLYHMTLANRMTPTRPSSFGTSLPLTGA
ncbi:hypothetical protein FA13DRAFT_961239 [Coprinellus micaceus]|uniref:Uncharacterized protein n=1 Tax=Coprinellus micaceus TaxID=71717 RepID=A0A4Y7SZV6_COPMI|nr:hypothetical protein FA13DRAFT_961239 [Coprinellus micaceus]